MLILYKSKAILISTSRSVWPCCSCLFVCHVRWLCFGCRVISVLPRPRPYLSHCVGGPANYPKSGGFSKDCLHGNLIYESILKFVTLLCVRDLLQFFFVRCSCSLFFCFFCPFLLLWWFQHSVCGSIDWFASHFSFYKFLPVVNF